MDIEYMEVDEDGYIVEVYALPKDMEVPDNYKEGWGSSKGLYKPRWDYEQGKWIDEITKEELEAIEQPDEGDAFDQLTEEEKDELLLRLLEDRGLK